MPTKIPTTEQHRTLMDKTAERLKSTPPERAEVDVRLLHSLLKNTISKDITCIRSGKTLYKYVHQLRSAGHNTPALDILLRIARKCVKESRSTCSPKVPKRNHKQKMREHAEMYEALDRTAWGLVKELVAENDGTFDPCVAQETLGDVGDVAVEFRHGYMPNTLRLLGVLIEMRLEVRVLDRILRGKLPADVQYMIQLDVFKARELREDLNKELDGKKRFVSFAHVAGLNGIAVPRSRSLRRRANRRRRE